jgi:hypothetical protein
LSEIRVKALKPLPEPLPEGERVLWQQAPAWRPFSRRVFLLDKIAIYFLIIIAWVAVSAYLQDGGMIAVARALSWSVPPALGVLGMIALVAWLYARTSVYTITSKRVVIKSGLALESSTNLPFAKIDRADLKTFRDKTGDIDLEIAGPRLLYSMVWPHVRFFRLKRPKPVMRGILQPEKVAELLGNALAADQPAEKPSKQPEGDFEADLGRTATS